VAEDTSLERTLVDLGFVSRNKNPELREEILVATANLLANEQFGDLTVNDILSAAGVSRGSF
jgi:AcrR family transcriptional regulator